MQCSPLGARQDAGDRRFSIRRRLFASLAAAIGIAMAGRAAAADYPSQSIQLIISFPPGGATDVLARELAIKMGAVLDQSIVVVNRPGAAGLIGMQAAARSNPDGYTLYISSVGSTTINEAINGVQRITLDDLDAVGGIASAPHILVTPAQSGIRDVKGLVEHLKAKQGAANYASMGAGTLSNLEAEIFKEQTGVQAVQIPYKGSSQALPEVISGSSIFMFDSPSSSLPQQKAGRINVLAVASAERLASLPDVPTLSELGIKGLESENLFALMVPKGTPADRVAIVAKALKTVQADPAFQKAIEGPGFEISEISGADTPRFIQAQRAFWKQKVQSLHISAAQ
ncbi:tripartite tricarboxylate transporter substrate binding protein [Bordetella flabilis]